MKYRKKPVIVEARQFTGENGFDIMVWAHKDLPPEANSIIRLTPYGVVIEILTLEGMMTALPKDWIIRGIKGEFYPCKDDVFQKSYEAVHDED